MKKFRIFISLVLIMGMLSVSASAQSNNNVTASFDPATGAVTVVAFCQDHAIVKSLPYGTESTVASSGNYTHFDQITPGDLPYVFYMPDFAPYGKYSVYVVGAGNGTDTFMYYDTATAESVIPYLNSVQSGTALASAISSDASTLGIDMDDSFTSANYVAASDILFAAFKPFANSGDFYNKFNACLAMAAMKGANKSAIEGLLSGYSSYLGITYATDYVVLSSDIANELCNLISVMDFSAEYKTLASNGKTVSFANLFARTKALAAVRIASNWSALKKVFDTDYVSVLSDITSANTSFNLSLATNTYMNLISKKPFSTFADLKTKFDLSVAAAIEANKEAGKKPSGSTGGYISTPPGYTNPSDQYEETNVGSIAQGETPAITPTSITTPILTSDRASYWDVSENSWEHNAVISLGGNGIISGYEDGSYRSTNAITRAEFTKLIVAAFNIKASAAQFNDVNENDWFYPYVSVAAGSGIVTGYEGNYNPNALITREDAAVIIYRTAALNGKNYNGTAKFTDILDVSVYAMHAVRGLGNAGIINGDNVNRFNPKANLTRAEAAQLLYNFISVQTQ